MKQLEELIAEFCPDGVDYKPLGEILDYEQPTKYIVRDINYDDTYSTPVLTAGASFILGYTSEEDNHYQASKRNPVIIFDDFTTAFQWVDFEFKVKSSAMKILTNRNNGESDIRFAFFAMQGINFEALTHSRHWIEKYSKFTIPLPPLAIQKEIVRILDGFTGLIDELENEFAARRKQYEQYRDKLLTFGDDVEWKKLGEVFDTKNGYTPSKANADYWTGGEIPWFRMEDIRTNGRILNDALQHLTAQAVKGGRLFPANTLLLATTATIGEHALITVDYLANQQLTCFTRKQGCELLLDIKFAFYYFFKIDEWCNKTTNASNFAIVDIKKLKKLPIPLPPLSEQRRIVAILDKFDALCNDETAGLAAEIAARKKQYEYYRDKLLTFKRKESA